jgi:pimeloyl-ACP methyl ester carboxylesterase
MNRMTLIRGYNVTVGRLVPETVARQMRRLFLTPRVAPPRDWELPLLARAERLNLRFGLSALRWGSGPTVLLQHGWEGRPTQFALLIEGLIAGGYSVVALDGPGHGRSQRRETNVVAFARGLVEAASELPPLHGLIGHSMGGASALLATQLGLRTQALVTISAPGGILIMLQRFAGYMGLSKLAATRFIAQVEQSVGILVAHLGVERYQLTMPGLIVHAEDDPLVPVAEAEIIHRAWPASRQLLLASGGHRRVLADPQLQVAVLALLASVTVPTGAVMHEAVPQV